MRISTTQIEAFRLFMEPEQEWMTEDALLAQLRGEFHTNPAIELGLAFGKVLEDPDRYLVPGGYRCRGYGFALGTIEPALALIDRRGVFEAKAQRSYGGVDVVAKADHIIGAHLSEFKTTGSTFNFEKYADSCQWRFMVDIFEPRKVTYHVFVLDDHGNGVAELKSIESFNLYPYPALHQDCCELLGQFVRYVTAKGLDGVLRARQKAAA